MKTVKLFLLMLFAASTVGAQQKTAEYKYKIFDQQMNYFVYRDLTYDPEKKEVDIYGKTYKIATVLKKNSSGKESSEGNVIIPFIAKLSINPENKGVFTEEAISLTTLPEYKLEGYTYQVLDPGTDAVITTSEEAKPNTELMRTYPKAYPTASKSINIYSLNPTLSWGTFKVVETNQTYEFKDDASKLIKGDKNTEVYDYKLDKEFKFMQENIDIVDNKRRMAVVVTMKGMKGDKLHGFNNKTIFVTEKADVINQFDIKFDYPKSLLYAQGFGKSAADTISSFKDGAILIYGRAFGVGKKKNDPDYTRYFVSVLDERGQLLSNTEFKYGSEKSNLQPYYAYRKNNKMFLFAKRSGKDSPGYAVLTFDETGLINTKDYDYAGFKSMVTGPYSSGLTSNFGRRFKAVNHYVMEDGGVLLHGEAYEQESTTSAAGSGPISTRTTNTYLSHIFLKFSAEGNFEQEYVIPKVGEENRSEITRLKLIDTIGKNMYFIAEETSEKPYAAIIKINPATNTISKTKLSDSDLFQISKKVVYEYDEDSKSLIFVGKTSDKESFTIKSVVYTLN